MVKAKHIVQAAVVPRYPENHAAVLGVAIALVIVAATAAWCRFDSRPLVAKPARATASLIEVPRSRAHADTRSIAPRRAQRPETHGADCSPEEKATRVERIKHDYAEIRAKLSSEHRAAGDYEAVRAKAPGRITPAAGFPDGLPSYLQQLALLEREERADLAALLSPAELEDLEILDSSAGQLVQKFLGDTNATDEQRRAVFRLQRSLDEDAALPLDLSPQGSLAREVARQATQEQIRSALGDELFAAWLRVEGADYAHFTGLAEQQGLSADAALSLWRAKNDFTRRRLELNAQRVQSGFAVEALRAAQSALARETAAHVSVIVGAVTPDARLAEVFHWLPRW